jgi:hypothetical protein
MAARDRFGGTAAYGAGPGPGQQPEAEAPPGARPADAPQAAGLEVYGDCSYGSGEARAAYRDAGHDTVIKPGPLRPAVPGGFTIDDFTVDEQAGTATCPAGLTRPMSKTRTVTFGAACAGCPPDGSRTGGRRHTLPRPGQPLRPSQARQHQNRQQATLRAPPTSRNGAPPNQGCSVAS